MKALKWLWSRISHKLSHLKMANLKRIFRQHGMALVVIFLLWELIEDVGFPLLFIWLGNNVNPWFLTGAPISWVLCLHPVAVPLLWGLWMWFNGLRDEDAKALEADMCDDSD